MCKKGLPALEKIYEQEDMPLSPSWDFMLYQKAGSLPFPAGYP